MPPRPASPGREAEDDADREVDATPRAEERPYEITLRPSSFDDFVGQEKIKDNLRIMVEAARRRGDPVDHVLFCGPPGLGKTTLAMILAEERGVALHLSLIHI